MDNELTDDELLELTKDICNLKPYNICFCGGETLLRKIVLSCATLLKEAGIPNIAIVTNGSLVTQDVAKELFKAGINRFQVSLDGKMLVAMKHLDYIQTVLKRQLMLSNYLENCPKKWMLLFVLLVLITINYEKYIN